MLPWNRAPQQVGRGGKRKAELCLFFFDERKGYGQQVRPKLVNLWSFCKISKLRIIPGRWIRFKTRTLPALARRRLNWPGADELREIIRVALERVRAGRPTESILMVGLRGVGKTVLLDRMRDDAEVVAIHTIRVEAPESRSLPAILAPQLRQALLRLSRVARATEYANRALRGLAGFAKALKVKYQDIEVGFDFEPEPGLADNGDLEHDLQSLLEVTGIAAKEAGTALAIFVDELQYVEEEQLAALITALHRTSQRSLRWCSSVPAYRSCQVEPVERSRMLSVYSIFLRSDRSPRKQHASLLRSPPPTKE